MRTVNVLLNLPHELTDADDSLVRDACPGARPRAAPSDFQQRPDELDGREVDVLVTEYVPRALGAWPNLKFIQLVSAGINQLSGHPVWEHKVPVATASGLYSVPIAQFATGAILSLAHGFRQISQFGATRQWPTREFQAGLLLCGRTVGILGYGSIGRECARQLSTLGMRVVCLSRSGRRSFDNHFVAWPGTGDPRGEIPEQWFTPNSLHSMLPLCNVLLVTAPRTPATLGMIGTEQLAQLPQHAQVVVLSRGGIVNEAALAQALRSGQIGAAWVDAFFEEPPAVTNPLFDSPNITLTPHMSGVFADYWKFFPRLLAENLRRFAIGEPLLNLAQGDLGY
jgi:phosphoglycerate dehydrogenase-like enzyme